MRFHRLLLSIILVLTLFPGVVMAADFVFKVQTSGVDDTFTLPLYNGGTLILAFCDDENAVIKEDISEIYTVVWEDHYAYYIYPEYIIRWRHDTGATTTGFASQPAAAATITGEVSYIPIKYNEIVNRSARLTQRQDIIMAAPTIIKSSY